MRACNLLAALPPLLLQLATVALNPCTYSWVLTTNCLLCCRYVLVRADTLEAPSDTLLRSARRQLGEPSDSRVPLGTDATDAAMGAEPASVARSRPLPPVAEEEQQEQQEHEATQQEQQAQQAQQVQQRSGEAEAGQGGAAQPSAAALAAMAKQLSKLVRRVALVVADGEVAVAVGLFTESLQHALKAVSVCRSTGFRTPTPCSV